MRGNYKRVSYGEISEKESSESRGNSGKYGRECRGGDVEKMIGGEVMDMRKNKGREITKCEWK